MSSDTFVKSALGFLTKLKKNNSKEWFNDNRKLYEETLLEPAQEFVIEIGIKLQKIAPNIQAIPKIDKSIFRLHRDVRFSKDKSPYKTNLGILFWEGERKKIECSGFYFHLEPNQFMAGAGLYMFPKQLLSSYRDSVADHELGADLLKAAKKVEKIPDIEIYQEHYKRFPKDYDPSTPASKYLLYNGLYAMYKTNNLSEIKNTDIQKFSYDKFKKMLPIHKWLLEALG